MHCVGRLARSLSIHGHDTVKNHIKLKVITELGDPEVILSSLMAPTSRVSLRFVHATSQRMNKAPSQRCQAHQANRERKSSRQPNPSRDAMNNRAIPRQRTGVPFQTYRNGTIKGSRCNSHSSRLLKNDRWLPAGIYRTNAGFPSIPCMSGRGERELKFNLPSFSTNATILMQTRMFRSSLSKTALFFVPSARPRLRNTALLLQPRSAPEQSRSFTNPPKPEFVKVFCEIAFAIKLKTNGNNAQPSTDSGRSDPVKSFLELQSTFAISSRFIRSIGL